LPQPNPGEFVGSWVIPLTAHSGVLHHFDGGDGQIALHGRGGSSLLDPLGSARSHGCVRLDNIAIDWIATHVALGTPVRVS
jgi:lipoprotein-anchoring transpeptidase ErfK/SrfK